MSWRVLLFILLLTAGASTFGGLRLGEWLVAHAPVAAPPPNATDEHADTVVLDADGKPYLAQPPQPLVNGALGGPETLTPVAWDEPKVSLLITNTNPDVWVSAHSMSSDALRQLARADAKLPEGPADVLRPDVPDPGQGSHFLPAQTASLPAPTVVVSSGGAGRTDHWHELLRDELVQCAKLGFFQRPSCAWGARNRYCEPNRAWGSIPECPGRD